MFLKRFIPLVFIILLLSDCRKDQKFLQGEGQLEFTTDTVFFDTVFTRLPGTAYPRSINKRFLIKNPYKETVNINARIMGGSVSAYKMNIDGRPGRYIPDIEILPKDSAWVFVEASLEPNNLTNPAIVRDSIEFETNGNRQYIQLAAYGWDAYYLHDTVFSSNTSLILKDKPYVIVNTAFVDENVTLTIGPGLHFYCSPNSTISNSQNQLLNISALNVFGTLKINGSKDQPVVFEGDRLDNNYKDKPGQWRGIHFWRGSVNNEIRHALIKNSTIGLWVDSLPESGTHNLFIRNTIIKNISAYGVLGLTAKIYIENSAISNCGLNTFFGYYGGDYTVIHCSFYNAANGRRDPHVFFNNALRDENKVLIRAYDLNYSIVNSIVWGSLESEIGFDLVPPPSPPINGILSHCIYKSKTDLGGTNNMRNKDPLFENQGENNLKLKAGSPAIGAADPNNSPPADLEEKSRDANPDIGAYEL